jgi:hypothetical protein
LSANQQAHEFDGDSMAADEFLSKSNEVARAFTIHGGQEKLALDLASLQPQGDSEANFDRVFQSPMPVPGELLDGMCPVNRSSMTPAGPVP